MKRILMLILVVTLLLSACDAAGEEGTDIEAHDPWMRAAAQGDTSAVYLLMHNHSENADELIGASTDAAETVELQKSEVDANDVMQMTSLTSIPLPIDAEIGFEPGGLHIMLIGLKKDLKVGDKIMITLHFMHHEDIPLTVPVLDAADMGGSSMDGMP